MTIDQTFPTNPFDLPGVMDPPGFECRRELDVAGVAVELAYLPGRATRADAPANNRPAFLTDRAEHILREEALWRGSGLVLTPNRYPFATGHLVLWSAIPVREPPINLLQLALWIAERHDGTALLNTMGAAASVPRAHVHVIRERRAFLSRLPSLECRLAALDGLDDLGCVSLAAGLPLAAVGLRGSVELRARAASTLLSLRSTPAVNLVSDRDGTWIIPRAAVETPTPHFPHALGAAELWGRWCYSDRKAFLEAQGADLERALVTSCLSAIR
jgi:hypothetical protein